MNILSFFYPQVLETIESPISGEIKVIEQFGKKRLEIGGMTQSGGIVEKIWRKGLIKIRNSKFEIRNCLILGLGAGTAAKIIIERCKGVGVEIDPEVIRLGKKYFGLGEIKNLEIVIADAVKYVSQSFSHLTIEPFDFILVDLYQGREIPAKCQDKKFLQSLKSLRSSGGLIVFNRLYSREKKPETDGFVQKCQQFFREVKTQKSICNLMVFCR